MKFLDITGLQHVIFKLKEWVEKKLSAKVDTIDLKKYKKKKKTVQHIIGRAIPVSLDPSSQENWYYFTNHLPFRFPNKSDTKKLYDTFLTKAKATNGIVSLWARPEHMGNVEYTEIKNITLQVNSTNLMRGIIFRFLNTSVPYEFYIGETFGVKLDSLSLNETSLVIYITIKSIEYYSLPSFTTTKIQYKHGINDNKYIKTYKLFSGFVGIWKLYPEHITSINEIEAIGGYDYRDRDHVDRGKMKYVLKKRHSVSRKTLDPLTGKLKKIRTAPRFTKVIGTYEENEFGGKDFSTSYTSGYYKVYIAKYNRKQYIGDIAITPRKYEIKNGKRVPTYYKIVEI